MGHQFPSEFYTKTNWKNEPDISTPLGQANLNHIEQGIKTADKRIYNLDGRIGVYEDYETEISAQVQQAKDYSESAEDSATDSANSATASSQSASASALSASSASASATSASQSASSASTSETNASQSEANALASEQNAKTSEDNAKESEENAETYQNNALVYKDLAYGYKNEAQSADMSAQQSASNASTYETNASASATLSQSYAVGGTNTRTGEDTDNAKYYKEQAQQIADNFNINNETPTFTQASTRTNINSGETISTIMGKIKKFFADLKTVAFTGKASDVSFNNTGTTSSATTVQAGLVEALTNSAPTASNVPYTNTTSGLSATNVQSAIDEIDADKRTWGANSILGAKNLFTFPYYTKTTTVNGVTFTVNEDATITVNGTATADSVFIIANYRNYDGSETAWNKIVETSSGKFRLTGCPSGGSKETYYLQCSGGVEGHTSWYGGGLDTGNGLTFDANIGGNKFYIYVCRIVIINGCVCNNLVFKPMLRDANDVDETFRPYAPTNKELYEMDNNLYKYNGLMGAKNLIPFPYYRPSGYTSQGMTVTYDEDGVITVNKVAGTDTAYFALYFKPQYFIQPNTSYILSLELENATNTSIYVNINNVDIASIRNKASGYYEYEFTTGSVFTNNLSIGLYWPNTSTETNAIVKPMLRLASDIDRTFRPYAMTNKELTTPTFTQASTRTNINSGETISTIMGKIKKFFADLKTVAFTGKASDVSYTNTTSGLSATNVQGAIDETNNECFRSRVTANETSADDIVKPGFCIINPNKTTSGLPTSGRYGYLTVLTSNVANNKQDLLQRFELVGADDSVIYERKCSWDSTTSSYIWYPWKTFLPSEQVIAHHEVAYTASQAYSVGSYLTRGEQLKKVTSAIASGEPITGNNTSNTTVGAELTQINNDLTDIGDLGYSDVATLTTIAEIKNCHWTNYRFVYLCFRVASYQYASSGVLIPTKLLSASAFSRYEMSLYESPNSYMNAVLQFYSNGSVSLDAFNKVGFGNFSDVLVYPIK